MALLLYHLLTWLITVEAADERSKHAPNYISGKKHTFETCIDARQFEPAV